MTRCHSVPEGLASNPLPDRGPALMYHQRPGVLLTPVSLTRTVSSTRAAGRGVVGEQRSLSATYRACLVRNLVLFAPVFLWVLGQGLLQILVPALHPGGWYFTS